MTNIQNCGVQSSFAFMPGQSLGAPTGGLSSNAIAWQNPPNAASCVPTASTLTDILTWLTTDAANFICAGAAASTLTCAKIKLALEEGCIVAGAIVETVGFDATGKLIKAAVVNPITIVYATTKTLTSAVTKSGDVFTLSSDVKISSIPGNRIVANSDGIFSPPISCAEAKLALEGGCIVAGTITQIIGFDAAGGVVKGILPSSTLPSSVVGLDTTSIDTSVTNSGSVYTVSSAAIISPTSGNVLQSTPSGLFVPTPTATAAETPITTVSSSSLTLTAGSSGLGHTGITGSVKIDPVIGNILTSGPLGLSVFAANPTTISVSNTPTASMTSVLVGDDFQLTTTVKISSSAGNRITANSDGIFSPPISCSEAKLALEGGCIVAGAIVETVGFDATGKLVKSLPSGETPLTTLSSSSIALIPGTSGNGHTNVSATLIRDPDPTNALQIGTNGVGVFLPAPTTITAVSTPTLSLSRVLIADNYEVTGSVKVDPLTTNKLVANATGLYVAPPTCLETKTALESGCITTGTIAEVMAFNSAGSLIKSALPSSAVPTIVAVSDTPSLDLSIVQSGATYTISGVPIISTASGNTLQSTANGLFVPAAPPQPIATPLTVQDSTSIDLTAGSAGDGLTGVTAVLRRDPDPTNVLQIGTNGVGVFLPAPTTISTVSTPTLSLSRVLIADNYEVTGTVKVDPLATNKLVANAAGLYVAPPTCLETKTALESGCITTGTIAEVMAFNSAGILVKSPLPSATVETPLTTISSSSLNLIAGTSGNGHVGVTGSVKIDPVIGNILTSGPSGLSVFAANPTTISVSNTPTASMTRVLVGDDYQLTTTVKISSSTGNRITANSDGIFAPAITCNEVKLALEGSCIVAGTIGSVLALDASGNLIKSALPTSAVPTIVAVSDTPTLDLSIVQSGATYTISGVPIVSTASGNLLASTASGLMVTAPIQTPLTVIDSTSIDLTAGATGNGLTGLTAIVKRNPDPLNALVIGASGLEVFMPAPTTVSGTTTPSITTIATLIGNNYEVRSTIKIDPLANNKLVGNAAGLYVAPTTCLETKAALESGCVPTGTITTVLAYDSAGLLVKSALPIGSAPSSIVASDTSSIDTTVTNIGSVYTVSSVAKIDPASGNILTSGPSGLSVFAANPTTISVSNTPTASMTRVLVGDDYQLTTTVKISATSGNRIVANSDGIFAPPITCNEVKLALASTDCVPTGVISTVLAFDSTGAIIKSALPSGATPSSVVPLDTQSIDTTVTNSGSVYTVSSAAIISPTSGNILTSTTSGLYVPTPNPMLTVIKTNSIALSPGTTNGGLTGLYGDVIRDPSADNVLQIGPAGVYVPPVTCNQVKAALATVGCIPVGTITNVLALDSTGALVRNVLPAGSTPSSVVAVDTSSIDTTVSVSGSVYSVSSTVVRDPAVGNALTIGPAGVSVFLPNPTTVSGTTTPTATTTAVLTADNYQVTTVVRVSGTSGNKITTNADGLYVAPITCAEIKSAIEVGGCIGAGAIVTNVGFDSAGLLVKAAPAIGSTPSSVVALDTPTFDMSVTNSGSVYTVSGAPIISPTAGNLLTATSTGLFVTAPAGAVETPLTVLDSTSIDLTAGATGNGHTGLTAVLKRDPAVGNALTIGTAGVSVFLPNPTTVTGISTPTVTTTATLIADNYEVRSSVNISPNAGNLITVATGGLFVADPLVCAKILEKVSATTATVAGCIPNSPVVCGTPDRLLGYTGTGTPEYWKPRDLYHFEAYPTSNTSQQVLSNVASTLNDVTTLMSLENENGLCGGASWWDPTLSRITIPRPGLYTVQYALFIRIIKAKDTVNNDAVYAGLRFIRPAGTVNGRVVTSQANTLRGGQFTHNPNLPALSTDYHITGCSTFIATAGTQLSLRAVAVGGGAISSFLVRGDSGHFTLSEMPMSAYSA